MNVFLGLLASVAFVEMLFRLPLIVCLRDSLLYARKSGHLIRTPHVSDHWKEKVLLVYACRLFQSTLKMLLYLLIACLPVGLLVYVAEMAGIELLNWLSSPMGIVICAVAGCGYGWWRATVFKGSASD